MRIWKRILSIVLATGLVLGLCACKKEGGGILGGNNGAVNADANVALAKEYVYSLKEFDFAKVTEGKMDCAVQRISKVGEQVYIVLRAYDEEWQAAYYLISMNVDGSDMKSVELPVASVETAETAETDKGENASEETPAADNTSVENDMSLDEDFYQGYVYEETTCNNFLITDEGIYANKTYYYEDYSELENYTSIRKEYLCQWDFEGNVVKDIALEQISGDGTTWFYVNTIVPLSNDKVALLISGNENGKIVVDAKGTVSELTAVEALDKFLTNGNYSAVMPDGRFLFTYYNDDWTKLYEVIYDFQNNTATAEYPLPATLAYNGLSNLCIDTNGDMMYSNGQGVFKYHPGDVEAQQMMSFVNSDLSISYLEGILSVDSTSFIGVYSVYDDATGQRFLEGGLFTKVNPENIPDKEVLVLGGNYISSEIEKRVIAYNKSSSTHRIVLKDYSQYNTNDDYMAGTTQLNNDIISGNMPDILIVDSYNMPVENFAAKGLLADIGALISKDEELSKKEYMNNVFEACKIDGKLYEIVPTFSVSTFIGKTSLVGERSGWTMQEAQTLLAGMPEGTNLFGDMTRSAYFNQVMEFCGSDFVDVSTGKCSFDSEAFIALMEFAMTLPEEFGDDYYGEDWYAKYETQYRENRTVLANCYINSMDTMVYSINGSFGEDVSYVGMPTSSGQGSVIYTYESYALAANSKHLDEAWSFMRYYLTDEYQDTLSWQLPVGRTQFDTMLQKTTKNPVYIDENGKEEEYEYTYYINGENIVIDPLTQDQVTKLDEFVSSVTTRAYYNQDISNIVNEEMEAFYQGQKSAKEVAGIIQSRAQLFVNENR